MQPNCELQKILIVTYIFINAFVRAIEFRFSIFCLSLEVFCLFQALLVIKIFTASGHPKTINIAQTCRFRETFSGVYGVIGFNLRVILQCC